MVAKDKTACLPQDLDAWRRLAQEVLVQAARDANGKGFMSCREDVRAAKDFFHSSKSVYVHERSVWFGMAGIVEPPMGEMKALVKRLLAYGCNNRRGEGK